jgi:hypothetical protein
MNVIKDQPVDQRLCLLRLTRGGVRRTRVLPIVPRRHASAISDDCPISRVRRRRSEKKKGGNGKAPSSRNEKPGHGMGQVSQVGLLGLSKTVKTAKTCPLTSCSSLTGVEWCLFARISRRTGRRDCTPLLCYQKRPLSRTASGLIVVYTTLLLARRRLFVDSGGPSSSLGRTTFHSYLDNS